MDKDWFSFPCMQCSGTTPRHLMIYRGDTVAWPIILSSLTTESVFFSDRKWQGVQRYIFPWLVRDDLASCSVFSDYFRGRKVTPFWPKGLLNVLHSKTQNFKKSFVSFSSLNEVVWRCGIQSSSGYFGNMRPT